MPYSYTGNTKQLGLPHQNAVCVLKIDPTQGIPVEHLGHATADAEGNFVIIWNDWDGRIAICAFDDDETARLQCKVLDWAVGVPTNDRYSGFLTLNPKFFYELSEAGAAWENRVDAAATLEVETGFTAPLLTKQFRLDHYIGMPRMVLDQDCLLTEQNAGATDEYGFAGQMTVAIGFETGNDITTFQVLAGFGNAGDLTEAGNAQWLIGIEASKIVFKHQFGELGSWATHICSTETLLENDPYFLVVTRDATASNEVKFYVNALYETSVTQPSSSRPTGGSTAKFAVGGLYGGAANCFDGTIFSLYGSEQVLNEVQAHRMQRSAQNYYYSMLLGYSELQFFWPMREQSGSSSENYSDFTAAEFNGIHNRTIAQVLHDQPGGLQGKACTFRANGAGTRYVRPNRNTYFTSPTTFGGWFRTVTPEYTGQRLMTYYRSGSNLFQLYLNALTLDMRVQNASRGITNLSSPLQSVVFDTWEFLVCVIHPYTGDVKMYRNGELAGTYNSIPPVNPDDYHEFCVGSWDFGGSGYYRGYVCGIFEIFKELSAAEITELYQASMFTGRDVEIAAALVSQWTMDDIVGTTINDELSVNDGTINGTVPVVTDGRWGDAIELSGVATDYVDLGSLMSTGWAEMTITLWFRQAPGAAAGYMLAKYDAENNARCFYIYYDGADKYSFGVMSDPAVENAAQVASTFIGSITAKFDDGFWHSMVCRFEENVATSILMDATREQFATTPSTMADTAEPCLIGKCGSVAPGASAFDIDDLRLFDSYLSTDEVHQVLSGRQ